MAVVFTHEDEDYADKEITQDFLSILIEFSPRERAMHRAVLAISVVATASAQEKARWPVVFRPSTLDRLTTSVKNTDMPVGPGMPVFGHGALVPFSQQFKATCWHAAMCPPSDQPGKRCEWKFSATQEGRRQADRGFRCGMERDTQKQIWKYMAPDSVVLELGSRFGTVSCTISKRQQYTGLRLSVEADWHAYTHFLQPNVDANSCAGMQVFGLVGRRRGSSPGSRILPWSSRGSHTATNSHYGARFAADGAGDANASIPNFRIAELEQKLAANVGRTSLEFTVLFIDCEGCGFQLLHDEAEFFRRDSLRQVYLEADIGGSMEPIWKNYTQEFMPRMCHFGFDVIAADPNLASNPEIMHVIFERRRASGSVQARDVCQPLS